MLSFGVSDFTPVLFDEYFICIFTLLQAPYIIYVEVLEVEDLYTSPVPTKIMGSSLRHTKSEENLTGGEQSDTIASSNNISTSDSNQQNSMVTSVLRQTPVKNISPYSIRSTDVAFSFPDDDPNDCWSQEDDEITQQVCNITWTVANSRSADLG